jgi:hypothetical protein
MDVHGILHPLRPECRPAVLNIAEFHLLGGPVRFVLRHVHNLTKGRGLADGTNLRCSLE